MTKLIFKMILIFTVFFSVEAKSKEVGIGDVNSKVTIKVFSSLTCPACAYFHSKIFYQIKEEFIDKGLVRFEHHPFPLDLAALNAEIIVRCHVDNIKKFELLGKIYEKQKLWAVGSDINKINDSIKKIGLEANLSNKDMDDCLKNENKQDEILNKRIDAQKKYEIESTPTIFINEKKYKGRVEYSEFKKILEKNL
jgi:protein-disulfide isomerase